MGADKHGFEFLCGGTSLGLLLWRLCLSRQLDDSILLAHLNVSIP
jgi:hypothetical protein